MLTAWRYDAALFRYYPVKRLSNAGPTALPM